MKCSEYFPQESSSKTVTQKSKRKFVEVDANESMVEQPKSRKLKVVSSASGAFLEEPMTPEKKNKFGFTGNFPKNVQLVDII